MTSSKVTGGKKVTDGAEIYVESVDGKTKQTLKGDVVLISTGRRPNTDGLNAKEIGIKFDNRGRVEINKHFQTNISNIYAIGDVVQGAMLAHKAEEEGIACVELIAGNQIISLPYDFKVREVMLTMMPFPMLSTPTLNSLVSERLKKN